MIHLETHWRNNPSEIKSTPKGRTYHVSYGDPNGFNITDVWDSMEDFQAFGITLIPIMNSLGVDPGHPDVQQIHGIMIG